VHAPAKHILVSTLSPWPQVTLHAPIIHALYTTQGGVVQGWVLIRFSVHVPCRQDLKSTLMPWPQVTLHDPISQSL